MDYYQIINNKILTLRPLVVRSKIHVIRTLTRKVKSLKQVKSHQTEQQREKQFQKAEQIVKEIHIVKILKADDIAKLALANTAKSLNWIIDDPFEEIEAKMKAKVASHNLLVESVAKFQADFPCWETALPVLLQQIGKKMKRNKNVVKTLVKRTELPNAKQTETNKSITNQIKLSKIKISSSGGWSVEDNSDLSSNNLEVHKKTKSSPALCKEPGLIDKTQNSKCKAPSLVEKPNSLFGKCKDLDVLEKTQNFKCNNLNVLVKTQNGNLRECTLIEKPKSLSVNRKNYNVVGKTVPNIQLDSKSEPEKVNGSKVIRFAEFLKHKPSKSIGSLLSNIDDKPETKVIDNFFLSADGQTPFKSTFAVKAIDAEKDETKPHKYDKMRENFAKEFGRIPNRKELRLQERGKCYQRDTVKYVPKMTKRPKWEASDCAVKIEKTVKSKIMEGPTHPSWEAKKKLSQMLSNTFQGKKTLFS